VIFVLAMCILAGCGGGDKKPATPLDDAIGYFAKDAPFVAVVETDPDGAQIKQLQSLVGELPIGPALATRLQNLTHFRSARWGEDVRPQLGAPLVIGLTKPAAGRALSVPLVVAMRVKHPLLAKQTLLREPGFRGGDKSSGVRIYENPVEKRFAAVDGDVLVAATNRDILAQALGMKRSDNRMRESGFQQDLKGLPADGLVRISADPRSLIGVDPRLRPAIAVKWLASLRRLGGVLKVSPTGVTTEFNAATDAPSLTNADLPLAPQSGPLPLIGGKGEIQVGVRDPGRLARLAVQLWRAIAPKRAALVRTLEPRGIDVEIQVPRHLADLAMLAFNPKSRAFALRVTLHDSGDVRDALVKLAPALPALAALVGYKGLGVATPEAGESFYALAQPNGHIAVFGVVGNGLVAASEARRAADLSSEATHEAPGTPRAAAVVTLNARALGAEFLRSQLRGPAALFAPLAVSSLRDLTGTFTNSRAGLRGHFKLTIVK
ncbi:MAG: hypothetical protein QOJ29_2141, partial [Thermoleophilaceae bacterium]|nr:hypothetical protein [Thermoleophilaceae bacterium]